MVVLLALAAALANAVASICQRLGVEDAPQKNGPSLGLVRHMVQRRIWLVGFAIMALGYAAQATALHLGTLDVVQPLLVSELIILVMILLALVLHAASSARPSGVGRHGGRPGRLSLRRVSQRGVPPTE